MLFINERRLKTPSALLNRIQERIELYPDVRSLVYACLKELTDNVFVHAGAEATSIVVAQVFPETDEQLGYVQLCVVDSGYGIPATLRRSRRFRSERDDRNVIELAVQRGTSGTRESRGFGLWILRKLIEDNRSELTLLSGSACVRYKSTPHLFSESTRSSVLGKELRLVSQSTEFGRLSYISTRFTETGFSGTAVQVGIVNDPGYRFQFEDYMSDAESTW
ncbi:MAG: hypothetical protein MAG453_00839 [Calditrichaeota bacterium]|nr:hypothetical protein [Calditrichota bacterium]